MKTSEERRLYLKAWRLKNIEKVRIRDREHAKKFRLENPKKYKEYKRRHSSKHKDSIALRTRKWQRSFRSQILEAYGCMCVCCGESREPFLTLEHINHDGYKHRQMVGNVYLDVKRNGFPKDRYTILCYNCNCATKRGRICPHKEVILNVA